MGCEVGPYAHLRAYIHAWPIPQALRVCCHCFPLLPSKPEPMGYGPGDCGTATAVLPQPPPPPPVPFYNSQMSVWQMDSQMESSALGVQCILGVVKLCQGKKRGQAAACSHCLLLGLPIECPPGEANQLLVSRWA